MQIAFITVGIYFFWACALRMACWTIYHHSYGDCSAHPGCRAMIPNSTSGYCTVVRILPLAASVTATLTEEVPRSIPNKSIVQF